MIKLHFNEIKFQENTVLKQDEINLENQSFIVLKGESGSGKTTLLKSLALHNSFVESYKVDDLELMDMNEEDRFDVLYKNMAFVEQEDVLLEDLKIQDQIALIKDITGSKTDIKKWSKEMDMEDFLDKYPAQLSGGELKRASILLALIKCPRYLILDEPTASLDTINNEIVLRVLKSYVSDGHTVLASTHDPRLANEADVVYEITQKKLNRVFCKTKKSEDQLEKIPIKKNLNDLFPYFNKMTKHSKFYMRALNFLSMFCIALVAFSFTFNNAAYAVQSQQMAEMQTDQIIVYKPFYKSKITEGYAFGPEAIVKEEELAKLKKISHIKYLDWRYDSDILDPFTQHLSNYSMKPEDRNAIVLMNGDKIEKEYKSDSIIESTFVNNHDYSNDIAYKFQEKGVYLSSTLATELSGNIQNLKGKYIKTYMMIPTASSYGTVQGASPEGGLIFIDYPICNAVEVTLPIAGVLKWNDMGIKTFYDKTVYIDRDVFESYMKKEQPLPHDKFYIMDDSFQEVYVNEMPKEITKKPKYTAQYSDWSPTAYTVTVDSIDNMGQVIHDITEIGFSVDYAYGNYEAMSETTKNMQKGLKIAASAIGLIVFFVYCVMKYNTKDSEMKINKFFSGMSLTNKEIKKIKRKKYFGRAILVMVCSSAIMAVVLIVCNFMQIGYSAFGWKVFIIIILLSLLLEFILPMIIEKKRIQIDDNI